MATVSRGITFGAAESVTAAKLHTLVDSGTITGIVNADVAAAAAIVDTKLAQITTASTVHGTSITGLASVPAAAGVIPKANLTSVAQLGANADITSMTGLTTPLDANDVGALFGTAVDKSASYGAQVAATDLIVIAYGGAGQNQWMKGFTDANADPTRQVGYVYCPTGDTAVGGTITMPVKKGDYWKITVSGMTPDGVWVYPIGS